MSGSSRRWLVAGVVAASAVAVGAFLSLGRDPYAGWLARESAAAHDPSTYPVVSVAPISGAPPAALDDSINEADTIVEGSIDGVMFRPDGTSVVMVREITALKGEYRVVVDIRTRVALRPDGQGSPELIEPADYPVLLPGEHVVLLAAKSHEIGASTLEVLPWVGVYYVRDGVVQAAPSNPFREQVSDMSVATFLARLDLADFYPKG